jgi:hypothetical protein
MAIDGKMIVRRAALAQASATKTASLEHTATCNRPVGTFRSATIAPGVFAASRRSAKVRAPVFSYRQT